MTGRDDSRTTEADACALRQHELYRGKMQTMPKCAIRDREGFAIWYTPGVAAPCREIVRDPHLVDRYTNRGNLVAVVSDGSRVLGLGNIGAKAGLPVMEGKALLFKYLGGVDAVALCLATQEADAIVDTVCAIAPSFGGINLEDIAQPKCFAVLDALRERLDIPVWHDDQQGTATAVLAGLTNALAVVGKALRAVRIVLVGAGAANIAVYRLLTASGVDPRAIVAVDSRGALGRDRDDIEAQQTTFPDKWRICCETAPPSGCRDLAGALRGADVCIAFSRSSPGVIAPNWIAGMAKDAIVFACANPVPEIWPRDARAAGARIVATGRSDFPNQLNNSLVFPGLFRGVFDVGALSITDRMATAAAMALADHARTNGLADDAILPDMADWRTACVVAVAVGRQAQSDGVAQSSLSSAELEATASTAIRRARDDTARLFGISQL
jgi:malate dehydrogenase (oxaloacetate-decarboxylating)